MVERRPLRHNIAKKRVILLNLRLLARLHGIAEKKAGLLFPFKIVLKGGNIGELSAVVRKHHRHEVRKSACSQSSFDFLKLQGSLYGSLIVEQKPKHEMEGDEVDGDDDFAVWSSDDGIEPRMCGKTLFFHMREEIRMGASIFMAEGTTSACFFLRGFGAK